jgi:acetyl esterase/lipase
MFDASSIRRLAPSVAIAIGSQRKAARIAGAAVLALATAVTMGFTYPPPRGHAPLRYRDIVFPRLAVSTGLQYGSASDFHGHAIPLTLDLYRPARDRARHRPAIVLVHGGSYTHGTSKNKNIVTLADAFAERGYVAVSINYRLLGGGRCNGLRAKGCVPSLAAQQDAQAAVRWLRAHARAFRIDRGRIAVAGTSAGAATALAVAANPHNAGQSGNPGYSSRVSAAISISGTLPHAVTPASFAGTPPILMFNGTADALVPFRTALATVAELQKGGVRLTFDPLAGAGHVPFSTEGTFMIDQSVYFCFKVLHLARLARAG